MYSINKSNFRVSVGKTAKPPDGRPDRFNDYVYVETVLHDFVYSRRRLSIAHKGQAGFTTDSHIATAYDDTAEAVKAMRDPKQDDLIVCPPMVLKCPFKVDTSPTGLSWEIQATQNNDAKLKRLLHDRKKNTSR